MGELIGFLSPDRINRTDVSQTTPLPVSQAPSGAAGAAIAPTASSAAESSHVLKASGGNLYGVSGYIGAAGWIMLFDAASAPADGPVTPVGWLYAPQAGSWSMDWGVTPQLFVNGIVVVASSTGPLTKTAYSTNTVFAGLVQ